MSELIPFPEFETMAPSSRKETPDTQTIKMHITINTTTAGNTIPITLTFSAPIAGEAVYHSWLELIDYEYCLSFEDKFNAYSSYRDYDRWNTICQARTLNIDVSISCPSHVISLFLESWIYTFGLTNFKISHLEFYFSGTNASIGDKWAAEISAEVKRAVSAAFDSKYGRRSTMNFTGLEQTTLSYTTE